MRSILALWTCVAVLATASFVWAQEQERPEAKGQPEVKQNVKGAEVRELKGIEAGPPLSALPGVKAITYEEWQRQKDTIKSGLFLVDTDYLPRGLHENLQRSGLRLEPDGKLIDRRGQPVTLLYRGKVFAVTPQQKSETAPPPSGGSHLQRWGALLRGALIPEAQAAYPFPWRCVWWSGYIKYNHYCSFLFGCFYDHTSTTYAEVGGLDPAGGCGWDAPYTRIQYLQVRTRITTPVTTQGTEHCYDCDHQGAQITYSCDTGIFSGSCYFPVLKGTDNLLAYDGDLSIDWDWPWSY